MGISKKLIEELIEKKARGNNFQINNVKMKLMFKGIIPDKINEDTPDSGETISKIYEVANDFKIELTKYAVYEG